MIVRNIEYLLALEQEGHYERAAKRCKVSQPTLSAGIRQLEQILGIEIVRHGRRFDGFTREGLTVLEWSKKLHVNCLGLEADVASLKKNLQGSVRLGISVRTSMIGSMFSSAISIIAPNLEQHVTVFDEDIISGKTVRNNFDIIINSIDGDIQDYDIVQNIIEDRLVLIHSDNKCHTKSVSWDEALQGPLCILNSALPSCALDLISRSTHQHIRTNSIQVIISTLESGRFSAVIPFSFYKIKIVAALSKDNISSSLRKKVDIALKSEHFLASLEKIMSIPSTVRRPAHNK
jgi:DNA-binding transcriptional LysR family regulator